MLAIDKSTLSHDIEEATGVPKWTATIPTWLIRLRDTDGTEKTVHVVADDREFQKVIARIKDEAAEARIRWKHLHEFQQSVAKLQSIYSLTVHTSQGGTFGSVFVDLPDIRRRNKPISLKRNKCSTWPQRARRSVSWWLGHERNPLQLFLHRG